MKNETGFTLIELVLVIAVVSALVMALAFQYVGWQGGYNIESEMKQLHTDLMSARGSAMLRNRDHFVTLAATQYSVYDDTNPAPDGNGALEVATDRRVVQRRLNPQYPILLSDPAAVPPQINFGQKGLSRNDIVICANPVDTSLNADNDCIILTTTRINLGKLTTKISDGGACDAANCVAQ